MITWEPLSPMDRQTDKHMTENITFQQLVATVKIDQNIGWVDPIPLHLTYPGSAAVDLQKVWRY